MRYNRRTDRTRAGIGGTEQRLEARRYLRATARRALHEVNRPGTKVARRVARAKGVNANGLYFHGGELTQAAAARSARRRALKEAA